MDKQPPLHCELEFDLLASGYSVWWFPLIGVVISVVLLALKPLDRFWPARPANPWRLLFISSPVAATFGVLWAAGAFVMTYGEYAELSSVYRSGKLQKVEGIVQDFSAQEPVRGGQPERFRVDDTDFAMSQWIVTSAYHKTLANGGTIGADTYVKISHVQGKIVRLEVCRSN